MIIIMFQNKLYCLFRSITPAQLHDRAGSCIVFYMGNSGLMSFNPIYIRINRVLVIFPVKIFFCNR